MKAQKGFTLIEILISVAIVGILAAVAMPAYSNYTLKAKIKEAQANLVGLSLAAESSYQKQLKYPVDTLNTTAGVKAKFTAWSPSSDHFDYEYTSDGATFTITAKGKGSDLSSCKLTLTEAGSKGISGCKSVTDWLK